MHESYVGLVADPDVDLVYNALVNSLHAEWNIAALRAGKHVLSEKPLTSNADEARAVRAAARASSGCVAEGFHYLHHPVHLRLRELVTSGALGDIRRVDLVLATPAPPDTDPRWSAELAGGATMDLGCYVLDAARQLGAWIGAAPRIVSADATLRAPGMDASIGVATAAKIMGLSATVYVPRTTPEAKVRRIAARGARGCGTARSTPTPRPPPGRGRSSPGAATCTPTTTRL